MIVLEYSKIVYYNNIDLKNYFVCHNCCSVDMYARRIELKRNKTNSAQRAVFNKDMLQSCNNNIFF